MTRATIENTLAYLSHPDRIQETMEIRAGLREMLADMPMDDEERTKPLQHPFKAYQARKRLHRSPSEIFDEA